MDSHIPVLLKDTIDGLNIKKDGIYVDLTLGRGGHSSEILKRLDQGLLIGIDQDIEAIKESEIRLKQIGDNFKLFHANFTHIDEILQNNHIHHVDGILMDLGVSSPQFDNPERGFSYRFDAPLDMRMDQSASLTAKEVVNNYSQEQLFQIFSKYGEDRYAYQISKNIVLARQNKPIETTFELVEIIKRSKPLKELAKAGHPAKQIFQALRIEVNQELKVLEDTIGKALNALRPNGGRLAIITFHSLEDRIVKNAFKAVSVIEGNRINGPLEKNVADYQLVNRKPIVASDEELANNHRAVSAKLRIIERK